MFAVVLEHVCLLVLGLSGLRTYGNSFHCLGTGSFFSFVCALFRRFRKIAKSDY
jgi:hypothetical protein